MVSQFPRLKYFLSGYYHQDWSVDAGSTNECDLWEFYYKHENLNRDTALKQDIYKLLQFNDVVILDTLSKYQSDGRYWESPESAKRWLQELEVFVCGKNT